MLVGRLGQLMGELLDADFKPFGVWVGARWCPVRLGLEINNADVQVLELLPKLCLSLGCQLCRTSNPWNTHIQPI